MDPVCVWGGGGGGGGGGCREASASDLTTCVFMQGS